MLLGRREFAKGQFIECIDNSCNNSSITQRYNDIILDVLA